MIDAIPLGDLRSRQRKLKYILGHAHTKDTILSTPAQLSTQVFSSSERILGMEIPQDEKEILHELPVNGIVKKDGIRYITELDETKTRILDRYRIGKQIGKVIDIP